VASPPEIGVVIPASNEEQAVDHVLSELTQHPGADLLHLPVRSCSDLFFAVTIPSEIKRLQRQVIELVRYTAISNPVDGSTDPDRNQLDAADEGHPDT
jgi:CRISPR/Cas system CMR subunit Cmr4 (Cas7 group RAMP superfamily)